MKHLIKQNKWECLLYSFAMAANVRPGLLMELTGHDGSELVKGFDRPQTHKGWHIQEIIYCLVNAGYTVTPLELMPVAAYLQAPIELEVPVSIRGQELILAQAMYGNRGVITGFGKNSDTHHAVAFEGNKIYDPDGPTYEFHSEAFLSHGFSPQTVWIVK